MPKKKRVRRKPRLKRIPKGITDQQKSFCRHYLALGYNGTKAARAAGYSKHTATRQASRLLTYAHVQAELTRLARPVARKAELKASDLLIMLMRQADANPREFVTAASYMKKIADLDDDTAKLISSWKQDGSRLTEVKLKDGMKATELLMRNRGMLKEQMLVELNAQVSVVEQQRVKEFTTEELAEFNAAAATCQRLLHPETV